MGASVWNKDSIKIEASKFSTRSQFKINSKQAYKMAKILGIFEEVCANMSRNALVPKTKRTVSQLHQEALKYKTRSEFRKFASGAYQAACTLKILDTICSHMAPSKTAKYTLEELKDIALKYKYKSDLLKNDRLAYDVMCKRKLLNTLCSHFIPRPREFHPNFKWTKEKLQIEAKKYSSKINFLKSSPNAYNAIYLSSLTDELCSHMESRNRWSNEKIKLIASEHKTKKEFQTKNYTAYQAAQRFGILDEVCSHMKLSRNTSSQEQDLFDTIKRNFPKTQKLRDRKVKIEGKPHIQGFDVDIYIPELRKGIEFDGTYWHSVPGLCRTRSDWPQEDLENYHKIKDEYFLSKGIRILHVGESNWINNKEQCIKKCMEFLKE